MTVTRNSGAIGPSLLAQMPTGLDGQFVVPEPHFDQWDQTPHGYFILGVHSVRLGDVVLATHQVDGIGQAEQRGTPARRFDLQYVVGASTQATARLILPLDHQLLVKRYLPAPHGWARVEVKESYPQSVPAGLIPDYGLRVDLCETDVNIHGYEPSQTICEACAPSWGEDYTIVRHVTWPEADEI